jgi:hypothetical protein
MDRQRGKKPKKQQHTVINLNYKTKDNLPKTKRPGRPRYDAKAIAAMFARTPTHHFIPITIT